MAQLENADASAKRKIARLEQQVRVAETKAREIEREGRYEIAVAAEISRLRAETLSSEAGKLIGKDEHSRKMSAEQVYDFVLGCSENSQLIDYYKKDMHEQVVQVFEEYKIKQYEKD